MYLVAWSDGTRIYMSQTTDYATAMALLDIARDKGRIGGLFSLNMHLQEVNVNAESTAQRTDSVSSK